MRLYGWIAIFALVGCDNSTSSPAAGSGTAKSAKPSASPSASAPATGAPKASESAAPAPAPSGKCKLDGDWTGKTPPGPTPVNNQDLEVHFGGDAKSLWKTAVSTQEGEWSVDDKGLHIKNTGDVKVEKSRFQCPKDAEGIYQLSWSSCDSATLKLASDSCEGRSKAMDGITLSRKK